MCIAVVILITVDHFRYEKALRLRKKEACTSGRFVLKLDDESRCLVLIRMATNVDLSFWQIILFKIA